MPQKLLYSECKYGRLVAGQQPFEAVCPCCLTTMLIEACCQVDCGINADIYPLQTANNHFSSIAQKAKSFLDKSFLKDTTAPYTYVISNGPNTTTDEKMTDSSNNRSITLHKIKKKKKK